ncbi:MAG: lysozyme [Waterburya sp.]
MNLSIKEQRIKALSILIDKCINQEYLLIDYYIDSQCRQVLGLPERPESTLPYVSWMTYNPMSKAPVGRISKNGLELIKRWEGCRTNAYLCPANVWTIGYGHTKTAKPGMMISHSKADDLLLEDLKRFEEAVRRLVAVPLNQNQFDALVSFTFNVGEGALSGSTLLRLLNAGNYSNAASQFSKWVYAGKKVLPGLVARREDEYQLFIKP